jgi:proteic killer suppression protein
MIGTIRHKGLRQLYQSDDRSKLRPDLVPKISSILAALDGAESIDDLNRPSFRLHALKGERAGQWSIWVNGNWRLVFRFEDGQATDIDLVDYH